MIIVIVATELVLVCNFVVAPYKQPTGLVYFCLNEYTSCSHILEEDGAGGVNIDVINYSHPGPNQFTSMKAFIIIYKQFLHHCQFITDNFEGSKYILW